MQPLEVHAHFVPDTTLRGSELERQLRQAAIHQVRAARQRQGVVAFSGGFHGRTMMGMALTGKVTPYKAGFGPFPASIYHVPFPAAYHGVTVEDSMTALDYLFKADVDPARIFCESPSILGHGRWDDLTDWIVVDRNRFERPVDGGGIIAALQLKQAGH